MEWPKNRDFGEIDFVESLPFLLLTSTIALSNSCDFLNVEFTLAINKWEILIKFFLKI